MDAMSPEDRDELEAALRGTMCERNGMQILALSPEGGRMTMPVEGNTQPAGLLHGGATIALAESVASLASVLHARAIHGTGAQAVGTSVSATHHRSARSGEVLAVCAARHLGSRVASYQVDVLDQQERLLSTVMVSTMLLPPNR